MPTVSSVNMGKRNNFGFDLRRISLKRQSKESVILTSHSGSSTCIDKMMPIVRHIVAYYLEIIVFRF